MKRPDWDHYFMIIADAVSLRMSCDRARIGAVLVSSDHRILATGYGGAPSGMPSCDEVGHDLVEIDGRKSCVRTVHAEKNALLYAAKYGVAVAGATLYTTASTCRDCALACIQAGITRIVYAGTYVGARGGGETVFEMLESMGVKVHKLPLDEALKHWTPAKPTSSVQSDTPPPAQPPKLWQWWAFTADQTMADAGIAWAPDEDRAETIARISAGGPSRDKITRFKLRLSPPPIDAQPPKPDDCSNLRAIRGYLQHQPNINVPEWIDTIERLLGNTDPVVHRVTPFGDVIPTRVRERCRGGCSRGGDGPACGKPGCQG